MNGIAQILKEKRDDRYKPPKILYTKTFIIKFVGVNLIKYLFWHPTTSRKNSFIPRASCKLTFASRRNRKRNK